MGVGHVPLCPGCANENLSSLLLKVSVYLLILGLVFLASCSIHLQFWVQKKIFLDHSDIYYLLILGYDL